MTPSKTPIPTGLIINSQIPLDNKLYFLNEASLSNLGELDNFAFTYYKGMVAYCAQEDTSYKWKEIQEAEEGLLNNNFIYPDNWIKEGIDYSNRAYNFVAVTSGTEIKISAGTNITITGSGIISDPYIINSNLDNLGIVKTIGNEVISPGQSLSIINNEITGKVLTTKEYVQSIIPNTPDGSETKLNSGSGISITGSGTISNPYIINSSGGVTVNDATSSIKGILRLTGDLGGAADAPTTPTAVHKTGNETIDGIKTFISRVDFQQPGTSSIGLSIATGVTYSQSFTRLLFNKDADGSSSFSNMDNSITGVLGNIGIKSSNFGFATLSTENIPLSQTRNFKLPSASGTLALEQNLQKVVTSNVTLSNVDNDYTIFINNGATPITITIDSSITIPSFQVGFIQEGTGDVTFVGSGVSLTNPVGLKSKGQGYATFVERKLNTTSFFLLGDTKI